MTLSRAHVRLSAALLFAASALVPWASAHALVMGPPGGSAAVPQTLQLDTGDTLAWVVTSQGHTDVDLGVLAQSLTDGLGVVNSSSTAPTHRTRSYYDIEATVHWRVVARTDRGLTLAAQLTDVDARYDDQIDARSDLLGAPFLVHLRPSGALRTFTFARGYPEALARIIRGVVAPLAVALPSGADGPWAVADEGPDGLFEARYAVTRVDRGAASATLHRTKVPALLPYSTQIHRGRADAAIVVDLATGALESLELSEEMVTSSDNAFLGHHSGHLSATRVAVDPPATLPATAAEAQAAITHESIARAQLYHVDRHIAPRLEGLTVATIVPAFAAEVATNHAAGHVLLVNYLRRDPASSPAVAAALAARPTDDADPVVVIGFAALAAAGHVEAQQTLVDALTAPSSTPRTRERALISIMDLAMPEPFVLDAVWATRTQLAARGPAAAFALSLATNVYGALGDVKRDNPAITETVLANLGATLAAARDRYAQVVALDALANVGDLERVAPLAAPYFASPDPSVRTAAFTTFRRMPGDAAFARFAERFAAEPDPAVRREATVVARDMADTQARNAWARALAQQTAERDVLIAAVRVLGDGIGTHAGNEDALRGLLASTRDREVRRAIYAFISPTAAAPGGAK